VTKEVDIIWALGDAQRLRSTSSASISIQIVLFFANVSQQFVKPTDRIPLSKTIVNEDRTRNAARVQCNMTHDHVCIAISCNLTTMVMSHGLYNEAALLMTYHYSKSLCLMIQGGEDS